MSYPNQNIKKYASKIVKDNFDKDFDFYGVSSFGTINKNYSFVLKKDKIPKFFLKIHGKGKPLKEKIATNFYNFNNIINTPKIYSIGEDYTITHFIEGLKEPGFLDHVLNFAKFHKNLMEANHKELPKQLFSNFSRENSLNLIRENKNPINKIINYSDFESIISELPDPDDYQFEKYLIHGDPHRQNILNKSDKSFFLDLEHTLYTRPTVDLARFVFNYPPKEFKNILAIYEDTLESLPNKISLEEWVGVTFSDILVEGALSVVVCNMENKKELAKKWESSFKDYFEFIYNK